MFKFEIFNRMGSHPQKFAMHFLCKVFYILGLGDCWYEKRSQNWYHKKIDLFRTIIVNVYMIAVIIDEYFSFYRTDLTVKERNDLIQMVVGLTTLYAKSIVFMLQKHRIEAVLQKLLEHNREEYSKIENDRASIKKAFKFIGFLIVTIYGTLVTTTIDGIRSYIKEGIPFRTVVTYYPNPSHSGVSINILRFFIECHWWYLAIISITIDSLSYCSLIFLEYKFKLLQGYFKSIAVTVSEDNENKSQDEVNEYIKTRFALGIRLHENAMWCATNIQSALGNIYSMQVLQSSIILVNCLIKLVSVEGDMTFLLANVSCLITMSFMIGSYMISGGDITWEASELSTAIYECGWELTTGKHNEEMRKLTVVAIQRSQVPVSMTAFGVFTLSYSNFVTLLRSCYSFFTVMYYN